MHLVVCVLTAAVNRCYCITRNLLLSQLSSCRSLLAVGFYGGGTGDWDASVYAANIGAVVVTLNHRVGLLGFMTVDAASASAPDAGNFSANVGLLDQRAALVWVQGNIRGFGGDPGRVTLSGQSAGGASVLYHLTMPQSFPLFDQVLAQSPGAPTLSRTTAQGVALSVANESQVNCVSPSNASLVDVECMRAVPTQALVAAAALVQASLGMYALGPSIDGEVVPGDYIALLLAGQFKVGTPLLVGNVMFEGDIFATSMAGSVFGYPATALNMSQYDVLVPDILHPMYVTAAADVAAVESDYAYCTQSIGIYNTSAAIAGDSYVNCNAHWAAHSAVNASISSTPVFRYWWNVSVPQVMRLHIQPLDRVTHMGDIFLLFNGRVEPPFNFTLTADQVASVGIAYGYIANFLATGNPNTGTFAAPIAWPTFSAVAGSNSTLVLQGGGANPTFLSSDYENDSCDRTWQRMLVK